MTCSSRSPPAGCSSPAGACSCCSPAGATRSACSTSRCGSRGDVEALHVDYGLRDGGRRRRRVLRRAVRAARRRAARAPPRVRGTDRLRRGQPPGVGARPALRRGGARSRAATSPPATPPPTRSRPCSTGSRRRRGGARCSAWPRARAGSCARCSASRASRPPPTARRAGWRGARTPATRRPRSPATACATSCCRRCARSTPRPRPTCCARSRCCATRPPCSTRSSTPRSPRRAIRRALQALRGLPPALRRLAVQRLADRTVGGQAPAIGHRTAEVLALAEGGSLDVGGGLRAEARDGALRFGASRGPAAPHPHPAPP